MEHICDESEDQVMNPFYIKNHIKYIHNETKCQQIEIYYENNIYLLGISYMKQQNKKTRKTFQKKKIININDQLEPIKKNQNKITSIHKV